MAFYRLVADKTLIALKCAGKYGKVYEKGIYPEDVLLYYGATVYGSGPEALGTKSPRNRYARRKFLSILGPSPSFLVDEKINGWLVATGNAVLIQRQTTSCAIVHHTRTLPTTLRSFPVFHIHCRFQSFHHPHNHTYSHFPPLLCGLCIAMLASSFGSTTATYTNRVSCIFPN